jgi:peptidoglycan/LPS O-acetylase OafA/YrhL
MDLAEIFETPSGSSRILPMEGIRGFAMLLVFCTHYNGLFGSWAAKGGFSARLWSVLADLGHSGVDLFFVLSGFLIYGAVISRETPYPKFMARRIQRIYPPFLAVFAIYLLLSKVFPGESKIPEGWFAASAYLVENVLLLPGIFEITPLITVAWSLSFELFYYLLIPAAAFWLGLRRWTKRNRVLFFWGLAVAYTAFCALDFYPRLQLIMFISGILLYEWLGPRPDMAPNPGASLKRDVAGTIALLACIPVAVLPHGWFLKIVVEFHAFFFFFYACFTSRTFLGRIFSWWGIRYLGNMSYSYYLLHGLTLKFVVLVAHRLFPAPNELVFWLLAPVSFTAALVSSSFLYIFIEKPLSLPAVRHSPVPRPG